jgi:hypothetical protein
MALTLPDLPPWLQSLAASPSPCGSLLPIPYPAVDPLSTSSGAPRGTAADRPPLHRSSSTPRPSYAASLGSTGRQAPARESTNTGGLWAFVAYRPPLHRGPATPNTCLVFSVAGRPLGLARSGRYLLCAVLGL